MSANFHFCASVFSISVPLSTTLTRILHVATPPLRTRSSLPHYTNLVRLELCLTKSLKAGRVVTGGGNEVLEDLFLSGNVHSVHSLH